MVVLVGTLAVVAFVLLDIGSIFALIATGALEGFRDTLPGYQERLALLNDQEQRQLSGLLGKMLGSTS